MYVASAARAFVKNDADALKLLDGTNVRPASIGGAAVEVAALGANRTPLMTFVPRTEIHSVDAFALICRGTGYRKTNPPAPQESASTRNRTSCPCMAPTTHHPAVHCACGGDKWVRASALIYPHQST